MIGHRCARRWRYLSSSRSTGCWRTALRRKLTLPLKVHGSLRTPSDERAGATAPASRGDDPVPGKPDRILACKSAHDLLLLRGIGTQRAPAEPAHLQTLAQIHARAIEHHPAIGRGDAQFLDRFRRFPAPSTRACRTRARSAAASAGCTGRTPPRSACPRASAPGRPRSGREGVPVIGVLFVEVAGRRTLRPTRRPAGRIDRRFARLLAEHVDDLVLEDAGEPGAQRGAAGEAVSDSPPQRAESPGRRPRRGSRRAGAEAHSGRGSRGAGRRLGLRRLARRASSWPAI